MFKEALREYHKKEYFPPVTKVRAEAQAYTEKRAGEVDKARLVLNIDETSLTNCPSSDFGFINDGACPTHRTSPYASIGHGCTIPPPAFFSMPPKQRALLCFSLPCRPLPSRTERNHTEFRC
jgi:hypothetical protein